jgi:hypothetical protein
MASMRSLSPVAGACCAKARFIKPTTKADANAATAVLVFNISISSL